MTGWNENKQVKQISECFQEWFDFLQICNKDGARGVCASGTVNVGVQN
jgi:hypothetical protein